LKEGEGEKERRNNFSLSNILFKLGQTSCNAISNYMTLFQEAGKKK
jgi:hypothetical protein